MYIYNMHVIHCILCIVCYLYYSLYVFVHFYVYVLLIHGNINKIVVVGNAGNVEFLSIVMQDCYAWYFNIKITIILITFLLQISSILFIYFIYIHNKHYFKLYFSILVTRNTEKGNIK